MRWIIFTSILIGGLVASASPAQVSVFPNSKLEVYVALVKAPTASIEAGREQWFQNLQPGLESFLLGLAIPGESNRPFSEVSVRPFNYADEPDRSRLAALSQGNPDYFYILRSIGGEAFGGILITNTFYFGQNKGDLTDPILTMSQVMKKETYQASRDAVTMATVYALANKSFAIRNGAAGCGYMHEALLLDRGIKNVSGDIARLSAALNKTAAKQRCGGQP